MEKISSKNAKKILDVFFCLVERTDDTEEITNLFYDFGLIFCNYLAFIENQNQIYNKTNFANSKNYQINMMLFNELKEK